MSNSKRQPAIVPTPAEIPAEPNLAAQIEWLELQLQDAHLVIGRQQMALLRAEQVNASQQQQNASLQEQLEQLAEQQASD